MTCKGCGELDEYVECRLTRIKGKIKFTQDVLVQRFEDEFDLPRNNYTTPAKPGRILTKGDPNSAVDAKTQTYFRSGVGNTIHMMQWSRSTIYRVVHDLTRYIQQAIPAHIEAMHCVMVFCVQTHNHGATVKPTCTWDGTKDFKFTIVGMSDSEYATNPETRKIWMSCPIEWWISGLVQLNTEACHFECDRR